MHTETTFRMDSHRTHNGSQRPDFLGWRGTSPEFGEITVAYPFMTGEYEIRATVRGDKVPTVLFDVKGFHVPGLLMPTLNRGTLRVGEREVVMSRNRLGVTRQGRALHLTHGEDQYKLWAISRKHYALARKPSGARPGVTVKVKQSGIGGRRHLSGGLYLTVTVEGRAEPTDIALAAMFSGVDRSNLTRGGAFRSIFSRGANHIVHLGS
ncbi:hypothetical protein GCM10010232_16220 [Streptomyces amakusaensis]|uniref:Uncharacterized protein n=1 Tax=Streptomyces amakusaensis TaxID=67271 RepID=A0ABW0AJD4_9ACTN